MAERGSRSQIEPDSPITSIEQDEFGRAPLAKAIAETIVDYTDPRCIVIALHGAWGSGKTSLLNMTLSNIQEVSKERGKPDPIVIKFNPWLYSSVEQVTSAFFASIENGLRDELTLPHMKDVSKALDSGLQAMRLLLAVGEFSPIGSQYFAKGKTLTDWALRRRAPPQTPDLEKTKSDIDAALNKLSRRLLIVIDDIDRLEVSGVARLFQMVRLNASFSNTTYLLAFDRGPVEEAISSELHMPGREYLEKIIQLSLDIPIVDEFTSRSRLTDSIDQTLNGILQDDQNRYRWEDLLAAGLLELVDTPRRALQLRNALQLTFLWVREEVNPVDFAAVEALRILRPSLYNRLRRERSLFLGPRNVLEDQIENVSETRNVIEQMFRDLNEDDRGSGRRICEFLFPQIRLPDSDSRYNASMLATWGSERRAASHDYFNRYFLFGVEVGDVGEQEIAATLALDDGEEIRTRLQQFLTEGRLNQFLVRAVDRAENVRADSAKIWIIILFETAATIPGIASATLSDDTGIYVMRLVHSMLSQYSGDRSRSDLLIEVIHDIATFGVLTRYVSTLAVDEGHTPTRDEPFSRGEWDYFRQEMLGRFQQADEAESLASKAGESLGNVLFRWKDWSGGVGEPQAAVSRMIRTTDGILGLVRGFQNVTTRHGRPPERLHYIDRRAMQELVDLDYLDDRVRTILANRRESLDADETGLLELFISAEDPRWY